MKTKIEKYIKDWETKCYFDGIPEEVNFRLEQLGKVPSYKQIVKAITKNDFSLKTLGFTQNKIPIYHEMKRIELTNRGVIIQLRLNL